MEEEKKRCPYCGEEILAVAKKCKHCGEWLDKEVKEMQACPVCGEMIEADMKVCPYCDEPTDFEETSSGIEQITTENIEEGSFLYCQNCKAKISASANTCPKCGDSDPFYFRDIKTFRKKNKIGCGTVFFIAILLTGIYQGAGSKNGLLTWNVTEIFIFCIVLLFVYCFVIACTYYHTKQRKEEMNKIFQDMNDSKAQSIWENKLKEQD